MVMMRGGIIHPETIGKAGYSRTGEWVRRSANGLRGISRRRYEEDVIRPISLHRPGDRAMPPLARWILLTIAAGTMLAVLGPFGSYRNGGVARLVGYWTSAMLLGLLLYGPIYRLVSKWTLPRSRTWWFALIGATLVASIPEAAATRAAAFALWPELVGADISLPLWFAQTATIGLIAMLAVGLSRLPPAPAPQDRAATFPVAPGVAPLGGDVLALQMEDHYVRVHRPAGSELLLMPLGRAIAAMPVAGLRTHRSWWVASHAVEAVDGNARAMRVRLSNGVIAPVARSAVIHLKAAGWLAEASDDAVLRPPAR
ncbi:LytR family transcriptional regulator [Sphingomonas metalli]|uniref:LytR family transcriptional regulator n=2 Tax=Sphingomonas metalli TaxID=1779358 RepID=A0A916SVH1_9SPHN|nr:LytR family transcriptional regulator [Sphingomonas metalli]